MVCELYLDKPVILFFKLKKKNDILFLEIVVKAHNFLRIMITYKKEFS